MTKAEAPPACFCGGRAVLGPVPQDGGDAEVQFIHATGCPKDDKPAPPAPIDWDGVALAERGVERPPAPECTCAKGFTLGECRVHGEPEPPANVSEPSQPKSEPPTLPNVWVDFEEAEPVAVRFYPFPLAIEYVLASRTDMGLVNAALKAENAELRAEIERLKEKPDYPADIPCAAQLATARAQVETLREALTSIAASDMVPRHFRSVAVEALASTREPDQAETRR